MVCWKRSLDGRELAIVKYLLILSYLYPAVGECGLTDDDIDEVICSSGVLGEPTESYVQTTVNGNGIAGQVSELTQWPAPTYDNEIMFVLPRALKQGDRVMVSGYVKTDRQTLNVNLITGNNSVDYNNIACQIVTNFAESENNFSIRTIHNGRIETSQITIPAEDILEEDKFKFDFSFGSDYGDSLQIFAWNNPIDDVALKHKLDQIRYLTVSGDVERVDKLEFEFAKPDND